METSVTSMYLTQLYIFPLQNAKTSRFVQGHNYALNAVFFPHIAWVDLITIYSANSITYSTLCDYQSDCLIPSKISSLGFQYS